MKSSLGDIFSFENDHDERNAEDLREPDLTRNDFLLARNVNNEGKPMHRKQIEYKKKIVKISNNERDLEA